MLPEDKREAGDPRLVLEERDVDPILTTSLASYEKVIDLRGLGIKRVG